MFDSATPSDNQFFETEGSWTKTVLRQAMRHDVHVYRLLGTRPAADISALTAFVEQDPRLQGERWKRFESRWHRCSNDILYMTDMLEDGPHGEQERDDIISLLVEADKES